MCRSFKLGDRVRHKQTGALGTVIAVGGVGGGGGATISRQITVEWDWPEGAQCEDVTDELTFVRPPPRSW